MKFKCLFSLSVIATLLSFCAVEEYNPGITNMESAKINLSGMWILESYSSEPNILNKNVDLDGYFPLFRDCAIGDVFYMDRELTFFYDQRESVCDSVNPQVITGTWDGRYDGWWPDLMDGIIIRVGEEPDKREFHYDIPTLSGNTMTLVHHAYIGDPLPYSMKWRFKRVTSKKELE